LHIKFRAGEKLVWLNTINIMKKNFN
jgi:hypothetical protein